MHLAVSAAAMQCCLAGNRGGFVKTCIYESALQWPDTMVGCHHHKLSSAAAPIRLILVERGLLALVDGFLPLSGEKELWSCPVGSVALSASHRIACSAATFSGVITNWRDHKFIVSRGAGGALIIQRMDA